MTVRELVEKTTAAQGFPLHVSDPAILSKIARLVAPEMPRASCGAGSMVRRRMNNDATPVEVGRRG